MWDKSKEKEKERRGRKERERESKPTVGFRPCIRRFRSHFGIASCDRSRGFVRDATRRRSKHPTGLTVKLRFRYSAQKERPAVSTGLNTKVIARPCVTCASISVAVYVGYVGYVREDRALVYCRASLARRGTSVPPHVRHLLSPIPAPRDPPNSRESRFRKDRARVQRFSLARASRGLRGVQECRQRAFLFVKF